MHRIFTVSALKEEEIDCPKCGWKGKGKDTVQEDLFLTDALELYCPSCHEYLGFVDQEDKQSGSN